MGIERWEMVIVQRSTRAMTLLILGIIKKCKNFVRRVVRRLQDSRFGHPRRFWKAAARKCIWVGITELGSFDVLRNGTTKYLVPLYPFQMRTAM